MRFQVEYLDVLCIWLHYRSFMYFNPCCPCTTVSFAQTNHKASSACDGPLHIQPKLIAVPATYI